MILTARFVSFGSFKGPRCALAEGSAEGRRETGFWDPVTYIGIRGCLLIPSACAVQSVALRGHELPALARSTAHKHANEDIPRVYTCGPADQPAGGGQRLVSVSPALQRKLKNVQAYPRPALPRYLCRCREFVNPSPSSSLRLSAWSSAASCIGFSSSSCHGIAITRRRIKRQGTSRAP